MVVDLDEAQAVLACLAALRGRGQLWLLERSMDFPIR